MNAPRYYRRALWLLAALPLILLLGLLPKLLPNDTTLQIRVSSHTNTSLPDGFYLYQQLSAKGIPFKSITSADNALVIHFDSEDQCMAAQTILQNLLPEGVIVAHQTVNNYHCLSLTRRLIS